MSGPRFELTPQEAADRLAGLVGAMCGHCEVPEMHVDSSLLKVGQPDGMREMLEAQFSRPRLVEAFSPAKGYMRFVWSDGGVANVEVREP